MRILALGAHPDDIEYGCGGLLLQAAAAGHEVTLHVLTDGGLHPKANRKAEQERAAEFLGARRLLWGGFRDTRLKADRRLIVAIEKSLDSVRPDLVLVNDPHDAHQDHQALASCAVTACRYVKRVLFYHDYTAMGFMPDTFVDIGTVLEKKRRLLACHHSQVTKSYPTGLDILESVTALAAYYGFMAKVRYAEGFRPLRYLMTIPPRGRGKE
jgi:LmbE family N-acetylglucosaminyl deacetylase